MLGPARCSIAVDEAFDALMLGAMDAAEDGVGVLHAMADDAAVAMRADGRERLDRAGVEVLAAARRSAVGGRRAQAVAAE